MQQMRNTPEPWVWSVTGKPGKIFGVFFGEVAAIDPRDALSRALTSDAGNGQFVGQVCNVPVETIDKAPGNFDTTLDIDLEHVTIKLRKVSLASFDPPAEWQPGYSRWRHGGRYTSVRYPSGGCGCVSNNYADRMWRIVCDRRRPGIELAVLGDVTYPSREAAARAEYALTKMEEAGLYPPRY